MQGWKRLEFPLFLNILSTGWVRSSHYGRNPETHSTCGFSFSLQFGRLHYKAGAELTFHIALSKTTYCSIKNTFSPNKISSEEYNASSSCRDYHHLPYEELKNCCCFWHQGFSLGYSWLYIYILACSYVAASQILMLLEGLVFSWYWLILVWNKEHWPNPTSPIPSHFVNYLYWSIEGPKSVSVANEQNLQEHISTSWAFGSNLRTSGTQTY